MGYTTSFEGQFSIEPVLSDLHRRYLVRFCETRHMKRNVSELQKLNDPLRVAVGLPLGTDGEFFVDSESIEKDYQTLTIVKHNSFPATMPGLWCDWWPDETGAALVWGEGEKFYRYIEWLHYLMVNFLTPWNYSVNGSCVWSGESAGDHGEISVRNNQISVSRATPSVILPNNLSVFLLQTPSHIRTNDVICQAITVSQKNQDYQKAFLNIYSNQINKLIT